jgi:hypothetical protein
VIEHPVEPDQQQHRVDEIVARGPGGAFAVAGVATAVVIALYVLFYFVVYLPRGAVQ